MRLVERAVDGRGRSFAASMRAYQVAAAARRNASIATVRVATDLSEADRTRLADALGRQYGRDIQLNVIVDPERRRRRPGGHRRRSDRRNHRGQAQTKRNGASRADGS